MFGVKIAQAKRDGATAAAGVFGVEPKQECVEEDVVATGAGGSFDLVELVRGQRPAGAGQAAGFGDAISGAGAGGDEVVGDGAGVDGAGGDDDMFAGVSAVAVAS